MFIWDESQLVVIKSLTVLILSADNFEKAIKILGQNRQPGFPLMKVYVYYPSQNRWDCEY